MERETTRQERKDAWGYAIGAIKMDGREPSKELSELIKKEIDGTITTAEIKEELDRKYKMKE